MGNNNSKDSELQFESMLQSLQKPKIKIEIFSVIMSLVINTISFSIRQYQLENDKLKYVSFQRFLINDGIFLVILIHPLILYFKPNFT